MEDHPAVACVMTLLLEQERISVTTVRTGAECLARVREQPFDLILLDHTLPDMNGTEVCRHLKGDAALQHIPVMFFAAILSGRHESEARQLGAVDYLLKGFDSPRLAARILAEVDAARNRASNLSEKAALDTQRDAQSASAQN